MAKPMSRKDRFREWVSDNLRYMLLILAILVVIGLVLLIVHLVFPGSEDGEAGPKAEVTAAPTPAAESEQASGQQDGAQEPAAEFAAENNAQVSAVATTYYQALVAKDMDTVRSCVDMLASEDETDILEENMVEAYNDIITYTWNGPEEGTYVAFVSYNCKYKNIDTQLPMLTELYMYTNGEGNLVIASDVESDARIAEAMSSALEQDAVKSLVGNVQASYDQAMESDAELKAYVESIQ